MSPTPRSENTDRDAPTYHTSYSNIYTAGNRSSTIVNPWLVKALVHRGLWNESMRSLVFSLNGQFCLQYHTSSGVVLIL